MQPPNILLIVLDATRPDHLSCYGHTRPTTPGLERLAAEGVIFDHAFSTAPWTPPSHASLFTGTYPSKHGVDVNENLYLDGTIPTLAEILSAQGYATFAILPDAHLSQARGFHRGFADFTEIFRLPRLSPDYNSAASLLYNLVLGRDGRAYHSSRLFKQWLRNHHRRQEQPFFAFFNYKTAHNNYRSPRPFRGRFGIPLDQGQDLKKLQNYAREGGYAYMLGRLEMTDQDMEVVRSWYDGAIAYLDHRIQDLFHFLKRLGLYDNTLVIITADHGENFGDHGLAYHLFCLYDSLIHVPLLIKYPGSQQRGKRITSLVSLADVLPTILELIGCDARAYPEIQGKTLLAVDRHEIHSHIVAEFDRPTWILKNLTARFPGYDFSPLDRGLRCIRTTDYKLIVGSDGSEQLYHLPSDPGESKNLIAQRPQEANTLRHALADWLASFTPASVSPPVQKEDAAILKSLHDLGYL